MSNKESQAILKCEFGVCYRGNREKYLFRFFSKCTTINVNIRNRTFTEHNAQPYKVFKRPWELERSSKLP